MSHDTFGIARAKVHPAATAWPAQGPRRWLQCSSVDEALRAPLESLLSKSEKSVLKVASGTWQHDMLVQNIEALRTVLALADQGPAPSEDALRRARGALGLMGGRTDEALRKTRPGTAQASLLRNRLQALRAAIDLVGEASRRNSADA